MDLVRAASRTRSWLRRLAPPERLHLLEPRHQLIHPPLRQPIRHVHLVVLGDDDERLDERHEPEQSHRRLRLELRLRAASSSFAASSPRSARARRRRCRRRSRHRRRATAPSQSRSAAASHFSARSRSRSGCVGTIAAMIAGPSELGGRRAAERVAQPLVERGGAQAIVLLLRDVAARAARRRASRRRTASGAMRATASVGPSKSAAP